MKNILYVQGDVRNPIGDSKKLICHVVNDRGLMGSGVAKSLYEKWGSVRSKYYEWHRSGHNFELGNIQAVTINKDIVVINMIGQRDIKVLNGIPPIRYGAIKQCLEKVSQLALKYNANIHAPRFGSDRAGGDWSKIEQMIKDELCSKDISVTVYDLPGTVNPTISTASSIKDISNPISAIDLTGLFDVEE